MADRLEARTEDRSVGQWEGRMEAQTVDHLRDQREQMEAWPEGWCHVDRSGCRRRFRCGHRLLWRRRDGGEQGVCSRRCLRLWGRRGG